MIKYKHKSAQTMLFQKRTNTLKKETAFKTKIMLENEETWKEVSKIWKTQIKR